jgi:hypothetical protein
LISAYTRPKGTPPVPAAAKLYAKTQAAQIGSKQETSLLKVAQKMLVDQALSYLVFGGPVSCVIPKTMRGVEVNGLGDVFWTHATF